jgi:hypothetical protein
MYNDKSMSGNWLYQYRTPNTTRSANSWRGTVADEEGASVYVMVFVNATTCRMASIPPPPRPHNPASATHLAAGSDSADAADRLHAADFPKHEIEIGITHSAIQFAPLPSGLGFVAHKLLYAGMWSKAGQGPDRRKCRSC